MQSKETLKRLTNPPIKDGRKKPIDLGDMPEDMDLELAKVAMYSIIEEVLEKPLEEITLGDVWSLGSSGYTNIGIFDFTWKGLDELIQESGIHLNTTWGREGQNLLYLSRLRQKAQRAQQSTGVVTNYRRLTYIEKENHEKFKKIVGELKNYV